MSLLEGWKFFSRFFNTLIADDKFSLISRDNWMENIQMRYISKTKDFFGIFFCIFRISIKFKTFSKKDGAHTLCISEINDHEKRG